MPDRPALYDTHAHLQDAVFDGDREAVVARARAAGVRAVLVVGEDLPDGRRVLDLAARHPGFVVPALGVHPDRAPDLDDDELEAVEDLARRHRDRLGAIGEVGLDHRPRWDAAARERQAVVFRRMIRLASELDLPLTVHSRGAGRHAIRILAEEHASRACLHAFDGRAARAEEGVSHGFSFSVPPAVTRLRVLEKLVQRLPLECLLLESDAPVLGPAAHERNEPSNVAISLARIASLRGEDPDAVAVALEANTARVFPTLVTAPR